MKCLAKTISRSIYVVPRCPVNLLKSLKAYIKIADHELAALLRDGDQFAYTIIFERYSPVLYKHAFRLLGEADEARDIIQDVFLALWQKRAGIDFRSSLRGYLYQAVRNRIFDHIAHRKVVARYADSIRNFMERGQAITEDQLRERELSAIIEREIGDLPPRMRQIFLLRKQEDLSYKEIGEQLNISAQTAKQQVYHAVKLLKLKINSLLALLPFLWASGPFF